MPAAPRVSVVMPVYEGERFLAEAVASALAATVREIEVVAVDDGSTDASRAVLARVHDERLTRLDLPHGGVAAARNAGLEAARAPVVAFLDQDDVMEPDHLAHGLAALEARPGRFVYADLAFAGDAPAGRLHGADHAGADSFLALFAGSDIVTPGQVLVRRDDALAAGGFPETPGAGGSDDRGLWLALAARGVLPAYAPHVAVRYRRHPGQASRRALAALRSKLLVRSAWADATEGDPPRRLVPADVAARVVASIEADLAYALLDDDPAEAEAVMAGAISRHPPLAREPAAEAYRKKRRRKRLGSVPVLGRLLRLGARAGARPEDAR